MASTSKPEFSTTQLIEILRGFDNEMRQAVEVGLDCICEVIGRVGKEFRLLLPIPTEVNESLPNKVFFFKFVRLWNNCSKTARKSEKFLKYLRSEARNIPPIPQPSSSTATAPVDDTSSTIPPPDPTVSPVTTPLAVPPVIPVVASTDRPVTTPSAVSLAIPVALPTALPTARPVTTPSVVPPAISIAPSTVTTPSVPPAIPVAAPTIPAVATQSITDPSASTTAVAKTVTYNPNPLIIGPPMSEAREDAPANSATSKPVTSNPATSKPVASKPATFKTATSKSAVSHVGESKIKPSPKSTSRNTKANEKTFQMIEDDEEDSGGDWERNNDIEDDEEQPDDDDHQPAEGSGGYKRRRPVKLSAIHKPTCDRCVRGGRRCHKEVGGGACYSCVVLKSKCNYAGGGHKEVSDREDGDVKETKGKAKVKGKTQRKSKEFVDDEIDPPRTKGSKSKQKWVDISDDENQKKSKQPVRRMKTAAGPSTSAAPSQQLTPAIEVVLNGMQSVLREMAEEIHDNFATCDEMSTRVQYIDSQIEHLKSMGKDAKNKLTNVESEMKEGKKEVKNRLTNVEYEMKEVRKVLREIRRLLLVDHDSSVKAVSGDEVKILKHARFRSRSVTHKGTRRPVTHFTFPSYSPPAAVHIALPYGAQLPLSTTFTVDSSPAAATAEPPHSVEVDNTPTEATSAVVPVETLFNANSCEVTPAMASRSNDGDEESNSPICDNRLLPGYNSESSESDNDYNLTLDEMPPPTPSLHSIAPDPDTTSDPKFLSPPPSEIPPSTNSATTLTGTTTDHLPAVSLRPPTPLNAEEVTANVPQVSVIHRKPLGKRQPSVSSAAGSEANGVANSVLPNDFLEPPNDIRMTRSRSQSTVPTGKRKSDNTGTGRPPKRRK